MFGTQTVAPLWFMIASLFWTFGQHFLTFKSRMWSVNKQHGSFIMDIPECIRCWPLNNLWRKRRRKRGSRGGLMIKLKARLQTGCISSPFLEPLYGGSVVWHLLDQAHRWLRPVLPLFPPSVPRVGLPRIGC